MPCSRARSATFCPASCRFKIPMICSSVNRPFFIPFSPCLEILTDSGPVLGDQVTPGVRFCVYESLVILRVGNGWKKSQKNIKKSEDPGASVFQSLYDFFMPSL